MNMSFKDYLSEDLKKISHGLDQVISDKKCSLTHYGLFNQFAEPAHAKKLNLFTLHNFRPFVEPRFHVY